MPAVVLCEKSGTRVLEFAPNLLRGRYTFIQPDGTQPTSDPEMVEELGSGGYGWVFRCTDSVGLQRAVKILKPDEDTEEQSGDGRSAFEREILLTNRIPYKHVISIIDYGWTADDDTAHRFYVMPYVDGLPLSELNNLLTPWRSRIAGDDALARRLRSEILRVVNDLLSGLVELDSAGVVHMDLKPSNALIYSSPVGSAEGIAAQNLLTTILNPAWQMHGFLIDLGGGKQIAATPTTSDRTPLISTDYYFPDHLKPKLKFEKSNKNKKTISREGLRAVWRSIDLFCFGRSLEGLFLDRGHRKTKKFVVNPPSKASEHAKEQFWRAVFADDFDVFEGLIDKLLTADDALAFTSAREAQLSFTALADTEARGVLASETLISRSEVTLQRPVGDVTVDIPSRLEPIVEHPIFRRLGGIHQLSLVDEIYPDATHTRLAHSLRTFQLTKEAVLALSRRSLFRLLFQRRDVDALLTAALIHDIGQYHFAHSLEDLRKMGDLRKDASLAAIAHDQDLLGTMCKLSYEGGRPLEEELAALDVDVEHIFYMIQKARRDDAVAPQLNIARDLINGIVDMDRIAYLVHDGQRTGVAHGPGVDIPVLLNAITIRSDADATGLGIEEFGVCAAESVLAATYWMYQRVYWHPDNRRFMAALKFVFMRLLNQKLLTFTTYREAIFNKTDQFALRYLSTLFDDYCSSNGGGTVNPLRPLTQYMRLRYTALLGIKRDADQVLYARILRQINPTRQEALLTAIREDFLRGHCRTADGELLIDVPLKGRLPELDRDSEEETEAETAVRSPLWVAVRGQVTNQITHWEELRRHSKVAAAFGAAERGSGREIRFFISEAALNRLSPTSKVFIEQNLITFVDEWTKTWGENGDNTAVPTRTSGGASRET